MAELKEEDIAVSPQKKSPQPSCCLVPTATLSHPMPPPHPKIFLQSPTPLETTPGLDLQHPGQARGSLNPANV